MSRNDEKRKNNLQQAQSMLERRVTKESGDRTDYLPFGKLTQDKAENMWEEMSNSKKL